MTDWIEWNGGECPIKSDKTKVEYELRNGYKRSNLGNRCRWHHMPTRYPQGDIIAYRIIEDHEPKEQPMTREQIKAQIEALQKQLDASPLVVRRYWDGNVMTSDRYPCDTHYFEIETINGVPHIHGVAMKEVGK